MPLTAAISLFSTLCFDVGSAFVWLFALVYICSAVGIVAVMVMENRSPLKTLAWLLVVLLVPVGGLLLYLFFGRSMRNHRMISRRRRQRLLREEGDDSEPTPDAYSPEARGLISLVDNLCHTSFSTGNTVEIFADGAEKFKRLEADLANARQYVLMQYYIFSDDTIGRRIADSLIDCARRGVRVRVIYDHLACMNVPDAFFRHMRDNGVDVQPFFKIALPHVASRANWRNHRKLCVIDGSTGYIGGMNIADRYIDGGPRFDMWRDIHLRVKGPIVGRLHYSFAVDWNFIGQPLITEPAAEQRRLSPDNPEAVGMQLITGGPTSKWRNLALMMQKAISSARKLVYIQTPYFLPSEGLLSALRIAALSKVDVRLMIPAQSDSQLLTLASCSYIQECLIAGVKVYFFEPGMLHSKMIVVDDDISSVGSTNFDYRSFEMNFEGNVMMYSQNVNRRLRKLFMRDIEKSRRIQFATWRRRPLSRRVAESLVRLLSPIL